MTNTKFLLTLSNLIIIAGLEVNIYIYFYFIGSEFKDQIDR